MRLSIKGDYGMRAMLDLTERAGQGPVQSEAIAKRQGISEAYLDQLLTQLRRAGLVRSVRGPRGGHELARPAEQITLNQVLAALEGDYLAILPDAEADLPSVKVQREIWQRVRDAAESILDGTTLRALYERQTELAASARYYI
ncbi:MAG TPA: Rrf2 family transcriptional regulator [Chloroflexota bacterium]|nr:Rrf2 family transcriptional regulator [Chloroflexota bacterium]